jgi:CRP-like cAMP-binding protein
MDLTRLKDNIQSLSSLTERSWQLLKDSLSVQTFHQGEFLLKEGQVCQSIFFVNQGYCRSFYVKDGNEISTQFHLENDLVSNTKSLVSGLKSDYWIVAGQEMEAVVFEKTAMLGLYRHSAEIESLGRKLLEQLLIKQQEHADIFKLLSPTERYQYLLRNHPAIVQRVPLTHIASFLGIARETLSRIRSKKV